MKPNRTQSPHIDPPLSPTLLPHQQIQLSNGIELYHIHDPNQEVFKMDILLPIGAYFQPYPFVASSTINMLNEGTSSHNSAEIADLFDFHGSFIEFKCGMHSSELSIFSLEKYASQTIGMGSELILESIFPADELEIYIRNKRQQLLVNIEKNSYIANKEFIRLLFGESHPYANHFQLDDFNRINAELIRKFYRERATASECRIMLSGNITDRVIEQVVANFSSLPEKRLPSNSDIPFTPHTPGRYHIEKSDALQSGIRIGRYGVQITDKDYVPFMLLNTVLGGYFGSRLMSNIREDKGYTYGINSFNVSMPQAAYWVIATDVNGQYTEATIAEINKELDRLRHELIPKEELLLVKNFFYGVILRELDGVYAQSDALKYKLIYGLDNSFYSHMLEEIKQCTPETLLQIAQKYLAPDTLYTITCGKSKNSL